MGGQRASEHWIFVVGWLSFGGAQRQSLHFAVIIVIDKTYTTPGGIDTDTSFEY